MNGCVPRVASYEFLCQVMCYILCSTRMKSLRRHGHWDLWICIFHRNMVNITFIVLVHEFLLWYVGLWQIRAYHITLFDIFRLSAAWNILVTAKNNRWVQKVYCVLKIPKAVTRIYFRGVLGNDTATARPEGPRRLRRGVVLEEGAPPPTS